MIRSQSRTVVARSSVHGAKWASALAKGIDDAIALLSADHDVVSVTVTPDTGCVDQRAKVIMRDEVLPHLVKSAAESNAR
jgi:hypothetical protein